jgi:hypothetical protein
MFIDHNSCFPGMVDSDQTCFRYVDKEVTSNEEYLYSNFYREQINQYGTKITYFVNAYNTLSADNFYGEDPTRRFAPGRDIIAFVELAENANTLTKFGFQADDEVTIHIHLSAFYETFYDIATTTLSSVSTVYETQYDQVQPKSGDVFTLSEYGKGRPGNRSGKQFEVTEILDEDIATVNPLGGHYTWIIKAKRFEYSFEPGITDEKGDDQVFDNSFSGLLSGGVQPVSPDKKYDEQAPLKSIDDVSAVKIFDMPANNNTDVYGSY